MSEAAQTCVHARVWLGGGGVEKQMGKVTAVE